MSGSLSEASAVQMSCPYLIWRGGFTIPWHRLLLAAIQTLVPMPVPTQASNQVLPASSFLARRTLYLSELMCLSYAHAAAGGRARARPAQPAHAAVAVSRVQRPQ